MSGVGAKQLHKARRESPIRHFQGQPRTGDTEAITFTRARCRIIDDQGEVFVFTFIIYVRVALTNKCREGEALIPSVSLSMARELPEAARSTGPWTRVG